MVRRRLISMLSALALVLTLFTLLPEGALKAHALTGTGTASDPFIVTTYDDLRDLLFELTKDIYIKLGSNIFSNDNRNKYELETCSSDSSTHTVTLDLAGHYIERFTDTIDTSTFYIKDSTLIIDDSVGTGYIRGQLQIPGQLSTNNSVFKVSKSGKLIIKNGKITSGNNYCFNSNGSVIIYNGEYSNDINYIFDFHEDASIEIYGGKFLQPRQEAISLYNAKIYGGTFSNYLSVRSGCTIYNLQVTLSTTDKLMASAYYPNDIIYSGATVNVDGKTVTLDNKKNFNIIGKSLIISTPIATHATIYTPDLVHGGKAEAAQVSGGLGFIMHENCITGWRDLTEGKDMQLGDTFTGGHKYRLGVTIGTQDGYVIGKTPDIFTAIDYAKITSVEKLSDFFCNVILEIDCPKTTVSTVNVTLTEPVAGVAINETMISDTTGASVYQSATIGITNKGTWYHGETAMSAGDKFAVGETYTAHFLIKADQGYEFADSLSVKVNGDTATLKRKINNYYVYEISYTVASAITTVSTVRIIVTEPKAGEIPEDATVFALPGKVPATVRTAWYHGDTQMASGEKFIAGETYTVKLLITRKASYEFSSPLKVFINNERVTSTNNSYSAVAEKSFTAESGQRLVGDANGDGLISADDAIIVARYAANYGNYQNEYDANVCDMNRDGHVTADDAIIIARYSANYGNYRDIYTNYV